MVTGEEIRRVKIFADLGPDECERLARAAADVSLVPGEFAAHEGAPGALFAVVEGRIEAVRLVDGVQRVIGQRRPGELFGEVPVTLGAVFPVGFRASGPSRVLRLEPGDYYALAAMRPDIPQEVGRLAANRMAGPGGLTGLAAVPHTPRAFVVGRRSEASSAELRRFLDRNQVPFTWVVPDASDAAERWGGALPPEEDWLVIRVVNGKTVVRPQLRRVAELLGLGTEPEQAEYDTVVVGAGPAGLAAAVYGASEGLRTVVVEREAPGGQAGTSSRIENYLGFPGGVSGDELATRALQQARRLGAEILVTRAVVGIGPDTRDVMLDGDERLRARTIILATGVAWRRLAIEGADRLIGKGVFYGASRSEAATVQGRDIHLIGAGNSAGQAAIYFGNHARSVTILARGDSLEKTMSRYLIEQLRAKTNVSVELHCRVEVVHGDAQLTAIDVRDDDGTVRRMDCGGLFVFIGADAETGWLPGEVGGDARGYVLTGDDVVKAGRWSHERDPYLLETSVPGIFACGDVRLSPVKRVAAAVGEGSMAIALVQQYLARAADGPT